MPVVAAVIATQATAAFNTLHLNMTFSSHVGNTRAGAKYSVDRERSRPAERQRHERSEVQEVRFVTGRPELRSCRGHGAKFDRTAGPTRQPARRFRRRAR